MAKIEDLTDDLAEKIRCRFSKPVITNVSESNIWHRVDVLDPSKTENFGKIVFKNNELYFSGSYRNDNSRDILTPDIVFNKLERFFQDGHIISILVGEFLVNMALNIVDIDLDNKALWRLDNPKVDKWGNPVQRRELVGKNPRHILRTLINNISSNPRYLEKSIKELAKNQYNIENIKGGNNEYLCTNFTRTN